jgi:hypothetical protein
VVIKNWGWILFVGPICKWAFRFRRPGLHHLNCKPLMWRGASSGPSQKTIRLLQFTIPAQHGAIICTTYSPHQSPPSRWQSSSLSVNHRAILLQTICNSNLSSSKSGGIFFKMWKNLFIIILCTFPSGCVHGLKCYVDEIHPSGCGYLKNRILQECDNKIEIYSSTSGFYYQVSFKQSQLRCYNISVEIGNKYWWDSTFFKTFSLQDI